MGAISGRIRVVIAGKNKYSATSICFLPRKRPGVQLSRRAFPQEMRGTSASGEARGALSAKSIKIRTVHANCHNPQLPPWPYTQYDSPSVGLSLSNQNLLISTECAQHAIVIPNGF
jgi:hypothetical protein